MPIQYVKVLSVLYEYKSKHVSSHVLKGQFSRITTVFQQYYQHSVLQAFSVFLGFIYEKLKSIQLFQFRQFSSCREGTLKVLPAERILY
jgi:hypothetical protein